MGILYTIGFCLGNTYQDGNDHVSTCRGQFLPGHFGKQESHLVTVAGEQQEKEIAITTPPFI